MDAFWQVDAPQVQPVEAPGLTFRSRNRCLIIIKRGSCIMSTYASALGQIGVDLDRA